jgi:hypothetical protein
VTMRKRSIPNAIVLSLLFIAVSANWVTLKAAPDGPVADKGSEPSATEVSDKNCGRCHENSRMDSIKPPTHDRTWIAAHGRAARWSRESKHGRECALCHRNAQCVSCHRTTAPRSHTGLWNVRLHGTAAAWDRDSCRTCHETGSCVSCHRRTPPLNHRGAWLTNHGRTAGFTHNCLACHPSGWCIACHRGKK